MLRETGIIIWVLTGDKVETAISIGHSCSLLDPKIKDIILDSETQLDIITRISNIK